MEVEVVISGVGGVSAQAGFTPERCTGSGTSANNQQIPAALPIIHATFNWPLRQVRLPGLVHKTTEIFALST
jgi:hypothetical protein